jgi:hypothetical protein
VRRKAEGLDPFGADVADDLAPFGVGVHAGVEDEPRGAGNDEKNAEGVAVNEIEDGPLKMFADGAAFLRTALKKIFGGDDDDHGAAPIRDGISVERAGMAVGVGGEIEQHPKEKDGEGDDGERMEVKKVYLFSVTVFDGEHGSWMWDLPGRNYVNHGAELDMVRPHPNPLPPEREPRRSFAVKLTRRFQVAAKGHGFYRACEI